MGKYMRKRNVGRTTPAAELGVRTRARSAAVATTAVAAAASAVAAGPAAPKRPRKQTTTAREGAEAAVSGNGSGAAAPGCCYLQLRSRRLFVPGAEGGVQCPVPLLPAAAVQRSSVASGEPVEVAGSSRCSSTASSVDVGLAVAPARERSGGEAEEAREEDYCDVESVVSDSAECRRERRETTPSSRAPVDPSDEECSRAADDPKRHRRWKALATATSAVACRARTMPPAEEVEQFFAAAEKAQAERFAAKYNFDVARGLPLGAGRYGWTPVASGW